MANAAAKLTIWRTQKRLRSRDRSRSFFSIKNACQLEGSDHGGRDSAAELALAGTIDVQASDGSCNRLALGPASPDGKNYTPRRNSVNEIFKPRNSRSSLTLISAIPILPCPQSRDGQVAQLVERGPEKAGVGGSIPSLATTLVRTTCTSGWFKFFRIVEMTEDHPPATAGGSVPILPEGS